VREGRLEVGFRVKNLAAGAAHAEGGGGPEVRQDRLEVEFRIKGLGAAWRRSWVAAHVGGMMPPAGSCSIKKGSNTGRLEGLRSFILNHCWSIHCDLIAGMSPSSMQQDE